MHNPSTACYGASFCFALGVPQQPVHAPMTSEESLLVPVFRPVRVAVDSVIAILVLWHRVKAIHTMVGLNIDL